MAISINGTTGVITGVSEGGLPDGSVNTADIKDLSITGDKLGTGSVSTDKIDSGAVTSVKLDSGVTSSIDAKAPLSQPEFTGNYVKVPVGDTASRPSAQAGMIRFNTDTNSMEQYDGSNWTTMAKPPIISSLSYPGSQTAVDPDGGETITISGANFTSGVNVKFGNTYATSVTRTNSTSLSVVVPALSAGTYDVIVENSDGMQATLSGGLESNAAPIFTTASGSLGSIQNDQTISTITIVATEDDSGAITYGVTTGALPTGLTLSGADIDGTPTGYTAETTVNFTITATDDENQTTTRDFSLTVLVKFYSYTIDQSLRFNDDDSANLYWTPSSSPTGGSQTYTLSFWTKLGNMSSSYGGNTDNVQVWFHARTSGQYNISAVGMYLNQLQFYGGSENNESNNFHIRYNGKLLDPSAWYHIVMAVDTTQATADNRVKCYLNGEQITSSDCDIYRQPPQNNVHGFGKSGVYQGLGREIGDAQNELDGYLAEFHGIDGQQLDPTYFGETKEGVWIPKSYSGSYGTNGFYLDFGDTYYNDKSGNGNNWTANNLSATDVVLDSPTNNFATMNPLRMSTTAYLAGATQGTFSEGNLKVLGASGGTGSAGYMNECATMTMDKWYAEARIETAGCQIGVMDESYTGGSYGGLNGTGTICISGSNIVRNNANVYTGLTHSAGDVIGVAMNHTSEKVWFSINGVWQGSGTQNPATGDGGYSTSGVGTNMFFALGDGGSDANGGIANFGQDSSFAGNKTAQGNQDDNGIGDFYYTPPTGYLALCNENLPDDNTFELDTGEKPSDHFNTITWTGTSTSSDRDFTGVGFQPDLIWSKARSVAYQHQLFDSVRGFGSGKDLQSHSNGAEGSGSSALYGYIDSVSADGFNTTSGSSDNDLYNGTNKTYVAWCWKAGGTAVSNTDGTGITSQVSANTTAGFSIATYSGTGSSGSTVGHGLNSAPEFVIIKKRNSTSQWTTWHKAFGSNANVAFNSTESLFTVSSQTTNGGIGTVNSTTVGFQAGTGTVTNVNEYDATYVMYCWHSVDGFSKIGSYTGNGSTDGTFLYTGFRPAWVMIKRTDSANYWMILDNKRNTYNPEKTGLYPNLSDAESNFGNSTGIDFVSNGFKHKDNVASTNASGGTYIYMAFAEDPFKYGNAR